jgi:hypothetical protein
LYDCQPTYTSNADIVIPAQAGIPLAASPLLNRPSWMPASAGMTGQKDLMGCSEMCECDSHFVGRGR